MSSILRSLCSVIYMDFFDDSSLNKDASRVLVELVSRINLNFELLMNNLGHSPTHSHLKIRGPCRSQIEMNFLSLDDRIPHNHKARAVWDFVEEMDISVLYETIQSFEGSSGRKATSPKVFFALWLYAITEGTVSARKIARECLENDAYRWIAGGIGVNRNNLASFRATHPSSFQRLLTESLAVMVKGGVLGEEDFSQDGTRIKAAAGFATFRSEGTINEVQASISKLIKEITKAERKAEKGGERAVLARQKAHAQRRLEKARQAANELKKHKETLTENAKKNHEGSRLAKRLDRAKASLVDPEARKMKMGDGGFRIAYNLQFATGVKSRAIYGVSVVNSYDQGTMTPMISQVMHRLSYLNFKAPEHWLADAAYSYKNELNAAYALYPDLKIVAAPSQELEVAKKIKRTDSEAVKRWRRSIGTEKFKEIYAQRCSTAEFSNMQTKAKRLGELLIRGIPKVTSMCLLHAIAFNMMRYWDLLA